MQHRKVKPKQNVSISSANSQINLYIKSETELIQIQASIMRKRLEDGSSHYSNEIIEPIYASLGDTLTGRREMYFVLLHFKHRLKEIISINKPC